MSNGYNDIRSAVNDTHKIIWGTWFFTGVLMIVVGILTDGIPVLGVIVGLIAEWGWIPATAAALIFSGLAEIRKDDARKQALRDNG